MSLLIQTSKRILNSLGSLTVMLLIVTISMGSKATAQDVMVIEATLEGVDLTEIINNDTLENGDFAERIYELQRNSYYFVSSPLVKDGVTLHIRAQEGEGTPPLILPQQSEGGSWPDIIRQRGDLTLEGIWIDSQNGDSRNAGRPIRTLADSSRIVIDGCYLVNARGTGLAVYGNNQKWYIKNSVFARMGQRSTPGGNGRPIDIRDARPVDSLVFTNNTMYMIMDRIVRTQGASLGYFEFDHNTVFNHEGEHGALQLGTVHNKAKITNNLFIDTQWKGAHPNIAEQTQKENQSHYLVTFDTLTTDLEVEISHNNAAWSPMVYTYWETNSAFTSKPPLLIPSLEDKMGTEAFNAAFVEEEFVEFTDAPSLADMADYMNNLFADPRPDPYPRWQETDVIGAPFIDATYPTTTASYTAGMSGLPLGDLNWFPDKKAEWEEMVTSNETTVDMPNAFVLENAYPNPFNPSTQLSFELAAPMNVTYSVYSVLGQKVYTENLGLKNAGNHVVRFNAANLSSGVYIVRMQAGSELRSQTITLIK